MRHSPEFTPAAIRACDEAGHWYRGGDVLPSLLLGLVREAECRAAAILQQAGITERELRQEWKELAEPRAEMAPLDALWQETKSALRLVQERFRDLSPLPPWATEHLLLAAALDPGETGAWLRRQGVDPEQLEAEIRKIYDQPSGPVEYEEPPPDCRTGLQPVRSVNDDLPHTDQLAVNRILDAAANRASEGLRVVEDYARFALDDAHLTRLAKELRHELSSAVTLAAGPRRLTARDTAGDVGTSVEAGGEYQRADLSDLLAANFQRAFQALRSLEEYAKVASPDAARRFEAIRYRAYTLERAIFTTRDANTRLAAARLYVLLDGRASLAEFSALAETLIAAGVHLLQLRDKQLGDRELLARARRLRELTAGRETLFIMNDRPDLAVLAGADGVHVGQEELSVRDVRRIVGPEMLIGVSTHSIEQARQAVLDGANYLGVGPVFPSGTKHFGNFPGLSLVTHVAAEITRPWFAIGGITVNNARDVLSAGATRIAVGGAVVAAEQPASIAGCLLNALAGRK